MQIETEGIRVKGAREHNLRDIEIQIPRNKVTVITGLSGSGKSSLAFDTIYAEGQRRYVESLSAYARQFLTQMKKPDIDGISGLSPAIAIDQKSVSTNPRSTVGTVTEVYDYLRLLFAKVGVPHCPDHHIPVTSQMPSSIVEEVMKKKTGDKFLVLAPVARSKKGEFGNEFQKWLKRGFLKARVDGKWILLENAKKLAKTKPHDIDVVIDQLVMKPEVTQRLSESIHTALNLASGQVVIEDFKTKEQRIYSIHSACPKCRYSFPEIEPRFLSFNNPRGACPRCRGMGTTDLEEVEQFSYSSETGRQLERVTWRVKGNRKSAEKDDEELDELALNICPDCQGQRLRKEALHLLIGGHNIAELADTPAGKLKSLLEKQNWKGSVGQIAEKITQQLLSRLQFLEEVGVGYLSMSRPSRTLSGGEAQRIRLASQVGSGLIGVLYVLDEPSIGLHPRDHGRMLRIIRRLQEKGNTILMVEHDEETIRAADYVVDMGPRAGVLGGDIIARGTPQEIQNSPESITGKYLSGALGVPIPQERKTGSGEFLELLGASGNNLRDVDLKIPLGTFVCVAGVSGSGKSTLIIETLYRILANKMYKASRKPYAYQEMKGIDHIDKVIEINQKPIGRTPRSTPATYVGLFPMIRDLFSQLPESRVRGYKPGHFSFNVKGGRCEVCEGRGFTKVEMHFLSDVYVRCEECQGRRYHREIEQIRYRGKSIADALEMTVQEALEFFQNHSAIHRKLQTLHKVGLDYLSLGQSSTTLSGGEAQRIKLSKELSKRGTGKTLYILDEPTTGLHFGDVEKLLTLLQELVTQGNTVLVIEHHLDVMKVADHLIDIGPEGGEAGGEIVAAGTPEEVVTISKSITGQFLKEVL